MAKRYPPTKEQMSDLTKQMAKLRRICDEVRSGIVTIYGDEDPRASRAGEVCASVQRLEWALERSEPIALA
jgi:hypothetical protein